NATIGTADVVRELAAAAETPGVVARKEGDAAAALAGAAAKLEAVYEAPFLAHVAMEPINCTVHVRPDSCEVWTGSQVLGRAQAGGVAGRAGGARPSDGSGRDGHGGGGAPHLPNTARDREEKSARGGGRGENRGWWGGVGATKNTLVLREKPVFSTNTIL